MTKLKRVFCNSENLEYRSKLAGNNALKKSANDIEKKTKSENIILRGANNK